MDIQLIEVKMKKKSECLILFLLVGLALSACSGAPMAATPLTGTPLPPTVTALPPTNSAIPPTETAAVQPVSTPESQGALAAGDPQRGQEIFNSGGAHDLYKPEYACATCHTLDGSQSDHGYGGPSLLGIATRAADRVDGLSAVEYIRQSIVDPAAYVTEGYGSKMSNVAIQWLTAEEIDDLVAFLLTQESTEDIAPPPQGNPILGVEIDLDREIGEGDALRGKNAAVKYRCFGCHAEDNTEFGVPFTATEDLPNILQRGELRIADPAYKGQATNNLEYILESIFLPDVYILPGRFEEAMPDTYQMRITNQELANIMAWIATINNTE
jgi:mono/diheme cytochrome c family protein